MQPCGVSGGNGGMELARGSVVGPGRAAPVDRGKDLSYHPRCVGSHGKVLNRRGLWSDLLFFFN